MPIAFEGVSYSYADPARQEKRKSRVKRRREAGVIENPPSLEHGKPAWGADPDAVWALRDITFALDDGEFLGIAGHTGSGKSTLIQHMNGLVHPTRGRVLLLALALMAVVFVAQSFWGLAVCAAFVFGFFKLAGIPLRSAFKSIAPLAFIVVVTALLNVFFVQGGAVLFEWWIIRISEAGLWQAAFIACRLLLLLLGMSLLTLTTATLDITDAFEYLLRPFRRIGVPAHELSMMMGIALRFLPQFTFELQTVYRAQISRGATFSKGRLRMLASLMVPLFTSAFRHAETLSSAMDARCYHGGIGRTRLHPLTFTRLDRNGTLVIVAMLACVIATNFIPW